MRQILLATVAASVIGVIAMGTVLSHAEPAPLPPGQVDGGPPSPNRAWMGGWRGHHSGPHAQTWRGYNIRAFALVYRQSDRQLSPADVEKIVEGFLLWNGNHTWKVSNVASTTDGAIEFSLTTPEGSVIAKFTMDPHTGWVQRIG